MRQRGQIPASDTGQIEIGEGYQNTQGKAKAVSFKKLSTYNVSEFHFAKDEWIDDPNYSSLFKSE